MDITQLILDDHHEQRRLFAILEQLDRTDTAGLGAVWNRLAAHMTAHVEGEERHFYPALLRLGAGAGTTNSSEDETLDAIKDHNEIRDASAEVERAALGSDAWYVALAKLNKANSEHMGEEEREGLTDFRRHAPLQLRHDIAVAFATFEAAHIAGADTVDKDPKAYVAANA